MAQEISKLQEHNEEIIIAAALRGKREITGVDPELLQSSTNKYILKQIREYLKKGYSDCVSSGFYKTIIKNLDTVSLGGSKCSEIETAIKAALMGTSDFSPAKIVEAVDSLKHEYNKRRTLELYN